MKTTRLIFCLVLTVSLCFSSQAGAAPPYGSLDLADGANIAGWARDPDHRDPIAVHIYIDGAFYDFDIADSYRPDVDWHAFHFYNDALGGKNVQHTVEVWAIGENALGQPDGQNVMLWNSPKSFAGHCNGFVSSVESADCDSPVRQDYWSTRQTETHKMVDHNIAVGINLNYGGAINQLMSHDRSVNLAYEHPGAMIQLSLWAPEHNPESDAWGTHDCQTPAMVTGNPIQTFGWNCSTENNPLYPGDEDVANDVTSIGGTGTDFTIFKRDPGQFTYGNPFNGLNWKQRAKLVDPYVRLDYVVSYEAGYPTWGPHPQEFPASQFTLGETEFPRIHYYGGGNPFTGGAVSTKQLSSSELGMLFGIKGSDGVLRDIPSAESQNGVITEGWWTVCNDDESHCVTMYSRPDNTTYWEVDFSTRDNDPDENYTYSTPLAYFGIGDGPLGAPNPGMTYFERVYIFPHKYDAIVNGQTIRDMIYALNADVSERGYYRLMPDHTTGKCVDVEGVAQGDADMQQYDCLPGQNNQLFNFRHIHHTLTGFVFIRPLHSDANNRCVVAPSSGSTLRHEVCDNSKQWHQWHLEPSDAEYNKFVIKNRDTQLCMTVAGGSSANGARIEEAPCLNPAPSYQVFRLEPEG